MRRVIRWSWLALSCRAPFMRILVSLLVIAGLAACGGGGSATEPQVGSTAGENDGQKQSVLDNLYAWYLWNDLLPDDLNTTIGADDDPNLIAALSYLNTGACPVAAATDGKFKAEYTIDLDPLDRRGPPHREYLDAY